MKIKPAIILRESGFFIRSFSMAELFGFLYLAILTCSVIYGLYYSLDWPMTENGTVIHYIAWRITQGAIPYRDIFEADFPGTFVAHIMAIKLLGTSDFAYRLFDLFISLITCGAIVLFSWRSSMCYALTGALFYMAFHLSNSAKSMAERDFLMVPFLLFAAYALRAHLENPNKTRAMLIFGVLTGCAFCIKPIIILFVAMTALLILCQPYSWQHKMAVLFQIGLGMLLPIVLIQCWLYHMGGLAAFYDILFNFTLPIYPAIAEFSFAYGFYLLIFSIYSFAFLVFLICRHSDITPADKKILMMGLLYGYLNFYLQRKGHWYHLYPLAAFIVLFFTIAVPRQRVTTAGNMALYSIIFLICLKLSPLDALSRQNLSRYQDTHSPDTIVTAAQDADEALRNVPIRISEPYLVRYPNQPIQFLSQDNLLWDVAYRQKWVTPSRQIMLFPLYDKFHFPYMDARADELFHDLSTIKPLVIVISSKSWPFKGNLVYHLIDTKEPWKTFFANHYRISQERYSYRVYARIK